MSSSSQEFRVVKKAERRNSSLDDPGERNIIALAIKMKMNPAEIRRWSYSDVDKVLILLEEQSKKKRKDFGQVIEEAAEDE